MENQEMIEKINSSVRVTLSAYVFEPNNNITWARIKEDVTNTLLRFVEGNQISEVKVVCDNSTNSQTDVEKDRCNVEYEFVIGRRRRFIATIDRGAASFDEFIEG